MVVDSHVQWGARVVQRLEPAGVSTIMDAGCGSGRVTELLLAHAPDARIVAVDSSATRLAEAADRLHAARARGQVELVHADLTRPLPVGRVDAIFSTATFHWIVDHDALFANLAAAVCPGGQLIAQCGGAGEQWAGATYFATPDETDARLRAQGFVDVRTWVDAPPSGDDAEYPRLNITARRG